MPISVQIYFPFLIRDFIFYFFQDCITFFVILVIVLSLSLYSKYTESGGDTIYDFTVKNIHGNDVDLTIYRGQVLIIVNIATKCTYADNNFEVLTYVNNLKVNGKPIKILAFPCNQFGDQEPGNAMDIIRYTQAKKAPFDLFAKTEVKGANANPLFKFLQEHFGPIQWNFYKFVIDENGVPVKRYTSEADFYKISTDLQMMFQIDDD